MADYVIRATAAEGQIRAFAATTRDLTETARTGSQYKSGSNSSAGKINDSSCDDGL